MNQTAADPRRWWALALLCAAFSMVILDIAIVNVALPSIQVDLDFTQENLQWIVTAYALTFGGCSCSAGGSPTCSGGAACSSSASPCSRPRRCGAPSRGRGLADHGPRGAGARRRAAHRVCALDHHDDLPGGRGAEYRARDLGRAGRRRRDLGVLLGGILTDYAGWEWIFLINLPVGIARARAAPARSSESKAEGARRNFDLAGAFSVTAGLVVLVYALVKAPDHGWGSARTIGLFVLAAVLLIGFLVIESRSKAPLMPLSFLRTGAIGGANLATLLLGAAIFAPVFILTLYMQQVLAWSPLKTGLAYLAFALTALIGSIVGQAVVTRAGVTIVAISGVVVAIVGTVLFTQISVDGTYVSDLLLPMLVLGAGVGFAFVAVAVAAFEGVDDAHTGLASGLFNTAQQIGGALGTAVLATVATSTTTDELKKGTDPLTAAVDGFTDAFTVAIGFSALCLVVVLLFLRLPRPAGEIAVQPATAD